MFNVSWKCAINIVDILLKCTILFLHTYNNYIYPWIIAQVRHFNGSDLCWAEIWVTGPLWILIGYPCNRGTLSHVKKTAENKVVWFAKVLEVTLWGNIPFCHWQITSLKCNGYFWLWAALKNCNVSSGYKRPVLSAWQREDYMVECGSWNNDRIPSCRCIVQNRHDLQYASGQPKVPLPWRR